MDKGVSKMNQTEYNWVVQTREILLDFCKDLKPGDFTRDIEGIGWQSIHRTFVHIADCYNAWLNSYILLNTKKPITSKEDLSQLDWDNLKKYFSKIDSIVTNVLDEFSDKMDDPIERRIPWRENEEIISMTPRKLIMHTVTHEFHHKGQIVSILRQMGYEPPNTDVLGTED